MPRSPLHELEARDRKHRRLVAVAALLIVSLLTSTWLGLLSFLTANAAWGSLDRLQSQYIPDVASMSLTLPDLSRVSRIYAAEGELLAVLHDGKNSEPTPIEEIPLMVRHAVLAAEDDQFYEHEGVDAVAILSAAADNLVSDTTRGGSTLTQQVVKNTFVGNAPTIERKIAEAFVAAELERRFTKDQILEFYLNSVYFGAGAYGIKAAAKEFYGKNLDQLTVDEAAVLAVTVRNPTRYDPRRLPELNLQRRNVVIGKMEEKGWITPAQAVVARRRPLSPIEHQVFESPAGHVAALVRKQLLEDPRFAFLGSTFEARKQRIFGCSSDDSDCTGGGGLHIYTTIDLRLQNQANKILRKWLPLPKYKANLAACKRLFPRDAKKTEFMEGYALNNSCAPAGAIATVDNKTGAVLVMASSLPFEFAQFDLAVQGRRNPGSAFKPFGLVAYLEQGGSLGSVWNARSPIDIKCKDVCSERGKVWRVNNADGRGKGFISLYDATKRSVNTVYAQVAMAVGPEKIVDTARRMGITSEDVPAVPSVVLGSGAVSPLEMASAFSNFATNGKWAEPYVITRIVDATGRTIYEHEAGAQQVVDPAIMAAARRPLLDVPISGTGRAANIGRDQGGKTGTHQNYQDAWYVGFVPKYSTAVWVGFAQQQIPLRNVRIHGQSYSRVFGGSVPAPIWGEFMKYMLKDVKEGKFPKDPKGVKKYLEAPTTIVPSVVGLEQDEAESVLKKAHLRVKVVKVPSLEPEGIVVAQSVAPGKKVKQGSGITIEISTGNIPQDALPDLRGLSWEGAQAKAAEFQEETGVRLRLVRIEVATSVPEQIGVVIDTDPNPGATVTYDDTVIVKIGVAEE